MTFCTFQKIWGRIYVNQSEVWVMPRADGASSEHDSGHDSGVNDNGARPIDAIPFTDLALAMGMDEDTLLQRLAAILRKREDVSDTDVAGE